MQRSVLALFEDILEAGEAIRSYVSNLTEADYQDDQNSLVRHGVERCFIIIGEALSRLAREDPVSAKKIGELGEIVAFRNILAHGYDAILDSTVWKIVKTDLPELLREIRALKAEEQSQ